MGNPAEQTSVIHTPIHNVWKGTRGTETSKYPEEKKETSTSLVAASERELAQTVGFILRVEDCISELEVRGMVLGKPARAGESPVLENGRKRQDPEYDETRETLSETGGTTPQG